MRKMKLIPDLCAGLAAVITLEMSPDPNYSGRYSKTQVGVIFCQVAVEGPFHQPLSCLMMRDRRKESASGQSCSLMCKELLLT